MSVKPEPDRTYPGSPESPRRTGRFDHVDARETVPGNLKLTPFSYAVVRERFVSLLSLVTTIALVVIGIVGTLILAAVVAVLRLVPRTSAR